jgi:hypothetical protein
MSESDIPESRPDWLEEFEELANERLNHGSSCDQVHPIVERWFDQLLDREPPILRDSIWQALSCLSSEVMVNSPADIIEPVLETLHEDDAAEWVETILLIGMAFQRGMDRGELDDL